MLQIINTPFKNYDVKRMHAGDTVFINGTIYVARDAAHKEMMKLLDEGKSLPFDIKDQIIYYMGPCPSRDGDVIGSAGPTTSGRMDAYAPRLIEMGLNGMIGKGYRSDEVVNAMIKNKCVYFGAIGGAGALIAKSIVKQEIIAFPELGAEALRKLTVNEFRATVIIDSYGKNLYETGRLKFKEC